MPSSPKYPNFLNFYVHLLVFHRSTSNLRPTNWFVPIINKHCIKLMPIIDTLSSLWLLLPFSFSFSLFSVLLIHTKIIRFLLNYWRTDFIVELLWISGNYFLIRTIEWQTPSFSSLLYIILVKQSFRYRLKLFSTGTCWLYAEGRRFKINDRKLIFLLHIDNKAFKRHI